MRLKAKIKREAKIVYAKGKANVSTYLQEVKARRAELKEIEREAKREEVKAYREALKIELMARAKERGKLKAKAKAKYSSGGGLLGQLGQIGRNLDGYDPVGIGSFSRGVGSVSSASNVVFDGMQTGKKKKRGK